MSVGKLYMPPAYDVREEIHIAPEHDSMCSRMVRYVGRSDRLARMVLTRFMRGG